MIRSAHLDLERVAARQRELEALPADVFAERARRAAMDPADGPEALAAHLVAHEQQVEMWTRRARVEEGTCPT